MQKIGKKLVLSLLIASGLCASEWDTYSDTWVATDELGRVLSTNEQVGSPKKNKTVGIFYYIWHGSHGYDEHIDPSRTDKNENQATIEIDPKKKYNSPYNIAEILKEKDDSKRAWGPLKSFHHWGKPLFDFYVSNDKWVMRKHIQMFCDAGVDVLIIDTTNAFHYRGNYMALFEVLDKMKKEGYKTPKLAFNFGIIKDQTLALRCVFEDLYSKNLYKDHWFIWKGKPLLLAKDEYMTQKYKDFFNIRFSWAHTRNALFKDGKDMWFWLDDYPQNYGWHEDKNVPEYVPVATAQHPHTAVGKSFDGKNAPKVPTPEKGILFGLEFERALELDPEFINITQWNEWIAMRFSNGKKDAPAMLNRYANSQAYEGQSVFIDVYDEEYNRDIEPMTGGWGDNYYYQMIDGIRKFKGVRDIPIASGLKSIKTFADFDNVLPEFRDDKYDISSRNHHGWGNVGILTDNSGRNDIIISKVARDIEHWFFYVETLDKLTKIEGENWMELFISDDKRNKNAYTWNGYNLRFAPSLTNPKKYNVYSYTKEGSWKKISEIDFIMDENKIIICFPRRGLSESFRFKWWDNRKTDKIIDTLRYGDSAPNGRFQYQYKVK